MKKQILFTLLGSWIVLFSQAQTVNYKVLKDDPNDLPLQLSLDPFYAEMSGGSARLGWGLRVTALFRKIVVFNFDIRKAYLDVEGRQHVNGSLMSPGTDGLKKQTVIEGGGALTFSDKTKSTYLSVVLSSSTTTSGNYQTTHTKYITVPGSVRKINGLHLGINQTNLALEFSEGKSGSFTAFNTSNPADFTGFGEYGTTYHGSDIYDGYTMLNTTSIYAGLAHKRVTNLTVATDYSRRKKGNRIYYDFYFDMMYGAVMHFADITAVDGTTFEVKNSDMKRMGWRFGWMYGGSSKSYFTYKAEFGSKPGYVGQHKGFLSTRFYLFLSMGWSIPFKAKFLNVPAPTTN